MANGRVITGFSNPMVADYSASGTTVTYSDVMPLARGVSVQFSLDEASDEVFEADNTDAESAGGKFGGGTVDFGLDTPLKAAAKKIEGTPAQSTVTVGTSTVNVTDYGDAQEPPYVGAGFIVRYMEDGVETWEPTILTKVKFQNVATNAQTSGGSNKNFQSETRTAQIFRDDTAAHNWKRVADAQTSEDAAKSVLIALLGGTANGGGGEEEDDEP